MLEECNRDNNTVAQLLMGTVEQSQVRSQHAESLSAGLLDSST